MIYSRRGFRRTGNWFWGSHWWRLRRSSRWRFWGSCRHRCSGRLRRASCWWRVWWIWCCQARDRLRRFQWRCLRRLDRGWLWRACYGCFRGSRCRWLRCSSCRGLWCSCRWSIWRGEACGSVRRASHRRFRRSSSHRWIRRSCRRWLRCPCSHWGVRRLWGSRGQWGFCGNAGCDRTGAADCAASAATNSHLKLDGRCADEPVWQPQDQAVSTWPDALFSRPQCFDLETAG